MLDKAAASASTARSRQDGNYSTIFSEQIVRERLRYCIRLNVVRFSGAFDMRPVVSIKQFSTEIYQKHSHTFFINATDLQKSAVCLLLTTQEQIAVFAIRSENNFF